MLRSKLTTPVLARKASLSCLLLLSCLALPLPAQAGEAHVTRVIAKKTSTGVWSFRVTVRHKDKGWKHYANNWDVLSPDGDILAERILAHPHVNEQPFTRSLSGVKIPEGITEVIVRAHDSVHEYGGQTMRVDLATGKTIRIKAPKKKKKEKAETEKAETEKSETEKSETEKSETEN